MFNNPLSIVDPTGMDGIYRQFRDETNTVVYDDGKVDDEVVYTNSNIIERHKRDGIVDWEGVQNDTESITVFRDRPVNVNFEGRIFPGYETNKSNLVNIPGLPMPVFTSVISMETILDVFAGGRNNLLKALKAISELLSFARKNSKTDEEAGESASEQTAIDIGKQIGKDISERAKREFHDKKWGNDRTKQELKRDAIEIYRKAGKPVPGWIKNLGGKN